MRLALLNDNVIGKELAVPIYLSSGMLYINEGLVFSQSNLAILKKVGIDTVYIKDEDNEINLKEIISTPIRLEVINELKGIFDVIKKHKSIDENKVIDLADKIISNIDLSENSFLLNNIGQKNNDLKLVTHSVNVTILAIAVGKQKGFNRDKLHKLALGALLHDVGKLFDEGEAHSKLGYEFIKNKSRLPVTSYMCILHHHEHENGAGYPEKITGDKISELAKVVAICNDYNNLIQSGKFALPSMAIEYIASQVGTKFSNEVYKEFISSIYCYPNGLYVQLNNGEKGIVVLQNNKFPARPMVGAVKEGTPIIYNLMQDLSLFIEREIL